MRRVMLLAVAAGLGFATGALAQGRPATPAMSCAAAGALVARAGAIVLTTGPISYDRIVRDGGFCALPETTEPAYETTLDNPQCFVGYRCKDKFNEGVGQR